MKRALLGFLESTQPFPGFDYRVKSRLLLSAYSASSLHCRTCQLHVLR